MNSGSEIKKISILGCGWLGLPLAEQLIRLGYQVQGSTTTPAKIITLAAKSINPFIITLGTEAPDQSLNLFLETDCLVVAFPPGIRAGNGEQYLQQIRFLVDALKLSPVRYMLFISSTSVYPELNKTVTEAEDLEPYLPETILLQAENLIRELANTQTTVLRFGGLVGGNRQPGRFLAGKQNLVNPQAPVNLIHLDDCLGLITGIMAKQKWGEIYNGCADEHPTRQEFYTAAALHLNLPVPHFASPAPTDSFKIICSEKIKKDLSYRFIHPDPMLFIK